MAVTEEEKKAARDDRDAWKRVSIWATTVGTTLSLAGGAIVGVPVLFVGALVTLGLRTNAELKGVEANRKVDDPPRADIYEPAIPSLVIPYRDSFGFDSHERLLAAVSRVTVEAVSLESSMVTAQEREMGARQLGAEEIAQERAAEHRALRVAAARWNRQLALHLEQLAEWFENFISATDIRAELLRLDTQAESDAWSTNPASLIEGAFPDVVRTLADCGYPALMSDSVDVPVEPGPPSQHLDAFLSALWNVRWETEKYARMLVEPVLEQEEGSVPPSVMPLPFLPGERVGRLAAERRLEL